MSTVPTVMSSPADLAAFTDEQRDRATTLVDKLLSNVHSGRSYSDASKDPTAINAAINKHIVSPDQKAKCLDYFKSLEGKKDKKDEAQKEYVLYRRVIDTSKTVGGVVGCAAGGYVGAKLGALSFNPAIAAAAAVGGAVIGGVAGCYAGEQIAILYNIKKIERSDAFQKWCGENIKNEVFSKFRDFVVNDDDVSDLFCSIIDDYPAQPVGLPFERKGAVFEKERIIYWIKTAEKAVQDNPSLGRSRSEGGEGWVNRSSPYRNGDRLYTLDDIVDRCSHHATVLKRLETIRVPPVSLRKF